MKKKTALQQELQKLPKELVSANIYLIREREKDPNHRPSKASQYASSAFFQAPHVRLSESPKPISKLVNLAQIKHPA